MAKAKYAMLTYYKNNKNQYVYYDKYEGNYIDHLNILKDSNI